MKKYLILCGLAVLALLCALSVHSQAPALDDLGNALVNHGQDPTTAGPTAAIIEVALANNNALIARLTADENNITSLLAQGSNQANTIAALQTGLSSAQGSISNDEQSISNLQSQATTTQGAEATDASNITALQASQTAAQTALTTLQGQVASLQPSTISALQAQVVALQTQLAQLLVTAPTAPLTILQQPTNQTVVLANGTVATFPMQFSSGGCHVLAMGQNVYGPTGDGTGNYTFKVTGVTAAMNGKTYQFQVYNCNQAGTVNTNTVTLTVQ